MTSSFQGAVFDFDGVIVDSHPVHKRAWKKFLQSIGKVASDEELQFIVDGRTRDDILRHFLGDLGREKLLEYGHRKEQFFRDAAANVRTIKGLRTFLTSLEEAQVPLSIASSGSRARVTFLLDHLRLKERFAVVLTADDVSHGKPHPAIFLKAADSLNRNPKTLIAFEDAVSGVKAAKSAGMTCIGIAHTSRACLLLDAGADDVVRDFRSLSYGYVHEVFRSASPMAASASSACVNR